MGNTINNGLYGIFVRGTDLLLKDNIINNSSNRSIYLDYGAVNTTISGNHTYHSNTASVYLYSTNGTRIFNNKFNYTGEDQYNWAVWKNSPVSNIDCDIFSNVLSNYSNQYNN